MKVIKSLLLGSAAAVAAVAGAQAADLPSRKAEAVSYVKICDAYGAGFFYIPGTDTCIKFGGYVRFEYQYVPGKAIYSATTGAMTQSGAAQDQMGTEVRGRIDVDARTNTEYGAVREVISLRGANTSGNRTVPAYVAPGLVAPAAASVTGLTTENAYIQFAGITAGIAPELYAMMPATLPGTYGSNYWAGFPNGIKQLAYTATFGGGFSASIGIEDVRDMGNNLVAASQPGTGYQLVGNVRVDQAWGFAAIHALWTRNSVSSNIAAAGDVPTFAGASAFPTVGAAFAVLNPTVLSGVSASNGWAIGTTVKFNLPMLAAGDAVWFTANYADGALGAIMSNTVMNGSNASGGRLNGGIFRTDSNMVMTVLPTAITPGVFKNETAWNVGAFLKHYWTAKWSSNFAASYVQVSPPNTTGVMPISYGKANALSLIGSIIFSPTKDFDIGLELQYVNLRNSMQYTAAVPLATQTAINAVANSNNFSTKLRIERKF